MMSEQILISEWFGLYKESWKGIIHDDAFAHPAKFSRALIRRIYDHVIAEGWATKGDSVVDPFGGVALGGFDAMRHGLNWYGCELEAKFVALGGQNIALWNDRFSRMPNWGTARLLNGDSRKLAEALSSAGLCVSSPPYSSDVIRERGGQLGAMKEGDHVVAISSPPYSAGTVHDRNGLTAAGFSEPDRVGKNSQARTMANYGDSEGQLGKLPPGDHSIAISSPPFENSVNREGEWNKSLDPQKNSHPQNRSAKYTAANSDLYGQAEGQLGIERGETFWSASRLILQQLHQVLAPNAHAVFVVKSFVRDKKIVDFPGQWAQLCEAVGFRLLHDHHALLTEHYGTQGGFEQDKELSVARKSFFRRLAESKGSPKIDYENVLCFVKP